MAFRVIRSLDRLGKPPRHLILCLGNFDGVHRGHRKIFEEVVREARLQHGTAAALTFDPHPGRVLRPGQAPPLLTTLGQKLELLKAAGMNTVFVLPFTRSLSLLTPRRFVETVLVERLAVRAVFVGHNFRFGHEQAGNAAVLKELGREFGFRVVVVAPVVAGGKSISSTRIRRLLATGKIEPAARLLGRPYALTGALEPGASRGQGLGFPTLNFSPEQECLPARGVYITETRAGRKSYPSVTNIGVRPTFEDRRLVVESHLLNLRRKVQATRLEVVLLRRLREEKKFSSVDALRTQIARDVARARRFFTRRSAG